MAAMKKPTPKPTKKAAAKPKPRSKSDYWPRDKKGKQKMPPGFAWGGKTGP